uniref:Carbohydrate kinase PfkB domain-containing protein n=1 Tax=Phlebotomus papatasi TaxID=29031 RepID=A0A1B0D8T4_PHLPP
MRTGNVDMNGATYKSRMKISAGGVGRNLAEGISKLHGRTRFISAVGDDQNGVFIRNLMPKLCITDSLIINSIHPTANCAVVLDSAGDCKVVVGDMQIHSSITPDLALHRSVDYSSSGIPKEYELRSLYGLQI